MEKWIRRLTYYVFRKFVNVFAISIVADSDMLTINPIYLEEKVRRDICEKLVYEAMKQGFVEIESREDRRIMSRVYTGRLKVIK